MKKALLKDSIKEIRNTYKRFLSIMLMAMLGVGFFAGIRATSPDMNKTIDNYYDENNLYDVEFISTLGLTDDDLELIRENEYVDEVVGTYSKDVVAKVKENEEPVIKLMAIENINQVVLVAGELPKNSNECAVEQSFINATGKAIGDNITIEDKDNNVLNDTLKITAIVNSPMYISRDRGTSNLGAGKVNYYIYMDKSNFDMDVYTQIYIKVKDADKYITGSNDYIELIHKAKDSLKQYEEEINTRRYDSLRSDATDEIEKAELELNNNRQDNGVKLDNAQTEIDNNKVKIENAKIELENMKASTYSTFAEYENQLSDGKFQIEQAEIKLEQAKIDADTNIKSLNVAIESIRSNIEMVDAGLAVANQKHDEIFYTLENPGDLSQSDIEYLLGLKIEIESEIENLEKNKIELNEKIYNLEQTINQINENIINASNAIIDQKIVLTQKEVELSQQKTNAYNLIANAEDEISSNESSLNQAQEELDQNRVEFEEKIKEAEGKIIDAKDKLNDIEAPKLYILEREDNSGYSGFIQDVQSVENIGKVFPVVFFVIATLISLTSMTRMVEEQRQQIGTMKALGYTKTQISMKYVLYASLATILGGIIGMIICFYILPKIIWMMYSMMYVIPNFVIEFNMKFGFIGLVVAIIGIVGATIYACLKELIENPATLMRPKAPKIGKRVLLEKIPFIWKHLNFTSKVTVRNMFRYKKRFLMTIIGIFGCTSLILFGFLLKDSVASIVERQYGKIFNYNFVVTLKSSLSHEEIDSASREIVNNDNIKEGVKVSLSSASILANDNVEDVQIIVPEELDQIYSVINFIDTKNNDVKIQNSGVVITDKVASLLKVKIGDKIIIRDTSDKEVEATVQNIVKNYVSHYMYMTKDTYEMLFGDYNVNGMLINTYDIEDNLKDDLAREIMNNSKVSSVSNIDSMKETIDDMMGLMKYVVWVLIVSAGLLAFVVLYNLATVNISERIRELATIKVLGFYDDEVYKYVSKETSILTVIGIMLGMIGGIILNIFILKTCEINILRFEQELKPYAFIVSALITIGFTIIINIATYFTLKKINMIESLKSVE